MSLHQFWLHESVILVYLAWSQRAVKAYTDGLFSSMVYIPSSSFSDCVGFANYSNIHLPSAIYSATINLVTTISSSDLSVARIEMQRSLSHYCSSLPPVVTLLFWGFATTAVAPLQCMVTCLPHCGHSLSKNFCIQLVIKFLIFLPWKICRPNFDRSACEKNFGLWFEYFVDIF